MTANDFDSPTAIAMTDMLAPSSHVPAPMHAHRQTPGEKYWRITRLCVPRLLNLLHSEGSGSLDPQATCSEFDFNRLQRRLQAALTLVLLDEYDPALPTRRGRRSEVFHALLDWQFSMRYDGVPRARHLRDHESVPVMADLVVQIITEAREYRSSQLLADVAAHLAWLSNRRACSPAQEAALLCALGDGAILVRKKDLLARARRRLVRLLAQQHPAGWFPRAGGWDVCEHVDLMDRLAHLADSLDWPELRPAVENGLALLERLSDAQGSVIGPAAEGWQTPLSPFAAELLASTFPAANRLTRFARRAADAITAESLGATLDQTAADLGIRYSRAGVHARSSTDDDGTLQPAVATVPTVSPRTLTDDGLLHYAGDGYRVVLSVRHGGALRVDWSDGRPPLEDWGVNVVQFGRTMVSGAWNCVERCHLHADSLTIRGWLIDPNRIRHRRRFPWLDGMKALFARSDTNGPIALHVGLGKASTCAGRFLRRLTWRPQTLTITDVIYCRQPFELLSIRQFFPQTANGTSRESASECPAVLEDARIARIRRTYYVRPGAVPEITVKSR